ncbi:Pentatricopeptide repeat-containing protein [Hibiscus syriacus]|uniref:Pentatricopeptide repeat-containing protein n=1 Tax=Hibiscus syriacus TaxID=106335 RepID=A0A6A2Z4E6_HIBSY|nr:pentatricopeptide repeat-containing protein At5g08305-like [Hibiscus syriacus]KAE8686851.1 Pentatricopeptide repeat-containing protein [Hibiscus syriacus]
MFQALFNVLSKCKSFSELKQIHALVITFGLLRDEPLSSKLLSVAALSDAGDIDYAYRLFSRLPTPGVFDWNTIIRGYSGSKNPNKSFSVFIKMLRAGVLPDHLTYPFLAKASARLLKPDLGGAIHGHALKNGFGLDKFINNSLIHLYGSCLDVVYARRVFDEMPMKNIVSWNAMLDGYSKCGDMASARQVFESMSQRDVVSWSCLINGYVKSEDYKEALAVFEEMRVLGPKANEVTMVSVLCACAHLGALDRGRLMHRYVMDNGLPMTLVLRTSLVDMYAKCGAEKEALDVFRAVSNRKTDVLLWNAMIGGLAIHGLVNESLKLFTEMQIVGIVPDEITYLCLLSACAHGGLVKEAWYFFECIGKQGMTPKSEHYACMVDVLARAGKVAEAYRFLLEMPMEPTASLLGALLNGCLIHGKSDLAEIVGRKLIELDPDHDGRYIGLSNVYAAIKRWKEARTMREAMERRGVKKSAGFSSVEISGALYRFIAHDETRPNSEQIYKMLEFIVNQMKLDVHKDIGEYISL